MPPVCFWDVMPIPRCALTAGLLHSVVHDVRTCLGQTARRNEAPRNPS